MRIDTIVHSKHTSATFVQSYFYGNLVSCSTHFEFNSYINWKSYEQSFYLNYSFYL